MDVLSLQPQTSCPLSNKQLAGTQVLPVKSIKPADGTAVFNEDNYGAVQLAPDRTLGARLNRTRSTNSLIFGSERAVHT